MPLAEVGSSSPRRANEGLFPPSGFLHFPARFLRFASCFALFRFLSPALLGGLVFLPLAYFISSHVALVWKQDFCRHCNSWCKPNSAGHYLPPSIRGRWSPIMCTCCSHWSKTLSASCSRSRCFTLKVSCGLSKATLQSIISRLLKTFLPTASRFYLLQ